MTDFSRLQSVARHAKHRLRNFASEWTGKRPRLRVEKSVTPLMSLGTEYGTWTFADTADLHGSTILSCGAGEDISFDLLFAARYQAKVIIIDPTPRAAFHVRQILGILDKLAPEGASKDLQFYGLRGFEGLSAVQLVFLEKAIWNESGSLKLFAPRNPSHVSHSALDFQNHYSKSGEFIEVQAVTYPEVLREFRIRDLPLLKLDVEGAEIEVVQTLAGANVLPRQICIEFDELLRPSETAAKRVSEAHNTLNSLGYRLVFSDIVSNNMLYTRHIA